MTLNCRIGSVAWKILIVPLFFLTKKISTESIKIAAMHHIFGLIGIKFMIAGVSSGAIFIQPRAIFRREVRRIAR